MIFLLPENSHLYDKSKIVVGVKNFIFHFGVITDYSRIVKLVKKVFVEEEKVLSGLLKNKGEVSHEVVSSDVLSLALEYLK